MKRILILVLIVGTAAAVAQIAPRINRAAFARLENSLDAALSGGEHPCEVFGNTNGVYVDGFGAVFTSTVAITRIRTPNPFEPQFTAKDFSNIRAQKLAATPFLKAKMRDMLFTMASSPALEGVRPSEQVVYGVTLFYYKWEEQGGLPRQIVMRGVKQQLQDIQAGRIPRAQSDELIKTEVL